MRAMAPRQTVLLLLGFLVGAGSLWLLRLPGRPVASATDPEPEASRGSRAANVGLEPVVPRPKAPPPVAQEDADVGTGEALTTAVSASNEPPLPEILGPTRPARSERPGPGVHGSVTIAKRDGSQERPAAHVRVEAFAVERDVLERFDPDYEWWDRLGVYIGKRSVVELQPDVTPLLTMTDEDGRFRFLELPPGWWVVRLAPSVVHDWQVPSDWRTATCRLFCHRDRAVAELPLNIVVPPLPEERITGEVVEAGGRPVAGAVVLAIRGPGEGTFAETGEDGSFTLDPLEGGPWGLRAVPGPQNNLLASEEIEATVGQDVRLVMRPSASLRGVVVDARTGEPAVALQATAMSADARRFRRATTADDGFEIQRLEGGTYVLYALGSEGRAGLLRGVVLVDEEHRSDLVVPLELAVPLQLEARRQGTRFGICCPGGAPFLLEESQVGLATFYLPPGDYELETYGAAPRTGALEKLTSQSFSARLGELIMLELP